MRVTVHYQNALAYAVDVAKEFKTGSVTPACLLYACVKKPSEGINFICEKIKVNIDILENAIIEFFNENEKKLTRQTLNAQSKKILDEAHKLAYDNLSSAVSTEHLFLSIISSSLCPLDLDDDEVNQILQVGLLYLHDLYQETMEFEEEENGHEPKQVLPMLEENIILSEFADNLNIHATEGEYDDIVDFDNKVDELATVLCKKQKPNAILIGPAGCGKTALVQGLASKIVKGEAPELLSNKVIYSVSLVSMVAGTEYRGQFEERLERFVEEAKKYDNLILFIDEIHTLMGAGGSASHSLEASNILKPALARGSISCIGATTVHEYKKTIKKDAALDRRFEKIVVRPPSPTQMKEILPNIVEHYEDFHFVKYSPEFLDNLIIFCDKNMPNRSYPDKAVDVVDYCGALTKIKHWSMSSGISDATNELLKQAENDEDFDVATLERLQKEIEEWTEEKTTNPPEVGLNVLQDFFEKKQNPIISIIKDDFNFMKLNKEVIGQQKALKKLSDDLLCSCYGLTSDNDRRPMSLLIAGPNNTGKSLFCRVLRDMVKQHGGEVFLFSGKEWNDYSSRYKIDSYDQNIEGLTDKILLHPNSTIIIDDLDMSHQEAANLMKQILVEGIVEKYSGELVDFSACKIIATCSLKSTSKVGFNESSSFADSTLKPFFKSFITFDELKEKDIRRIFYKKLNNIKKNLKAQGIDFCFSFDFIKQTVSNEKSVSNIITFIDEKLNTSILSSIKLNQKQISV